MSAEDTARHIIAKVGLWWPAADEGKLRQAAAAWDRIADAIDHVSAAAGSAAQEVSAANRGAAVDGFEKLWQKYSAGSGYLPTTAQAARDTANGLRRYADAVVQAKHKVEELALTVGATIAVGTALAFFTFGISEAAAGAATAELISAAAAIGMDLSATVAEIIATALVGATIGAVEGFALDVAVAQPIRVLGFHDGGFSWHEAALSAVGGGAGGGVAAPFSAATRELSVTLAETDNVALSRIASGISGGPGRIATGMAAAGTTDEATSGHLNPLDLALGGVAAGGLRPGIGLDTEFPGGLTARDIYQATTQARLSDPELGGLLEGYQPFGRLSPRTFADRFVDPNTGGWRWPEPATGGGVPGTAHAVELSPGQVIDRFGAPWGGYLSPGGTQYTHRALPPTSLTPDQPRYGYHRYEVVKPVTLTEATVASGFEQPGGGTQYVTGILPDGTKVSVQWLLDHDYLHELHP